MYYITQMLNTTIFITYIIYLHSPGLYIRITSDIDISFNRRV